MRLNARIVPLFVALPLSAFGVAGGAGVSALPATLSADSIAPAPGGLRLSALPGGASTLDVKPGDRMRLPLVLDLPAAAAAGGLGSINVELRYDPDILQFDSASTSLSHALVAHQVTAPGHLRLALAATESLGTGPLTLFQLQFTVKPGARAGASQSFQLLVPRAPLDLSFRPYPAPAVASGAVRVASR
jgi:hypothetical protein